MMRCEYCDGEGVVWFILSEPIAGMRKSAPNVTGMVK